MQLAFRVQMQDLGDVYQIGVHGDVHCCLNVEMYEHVFSGCLAMNLH